MFTYPLSWGLQRFAVAKYLDFDEFPWAAVMGFHCLCKSFGSLWTSEGGITNGVTLIMSMIYNSPEAGQRISWTFQCNGLAMIPPGFLSFGVAHDDPGRKPARWQLLIIFYIGLTAVVGLWFLLVFPGNPIRARFSYEDENVKAVRRIQANQSGAETKSWRSEQSPRSRQGR
ncbi:hypothetical protein DL768_002526 [Monosporascus sp. mg162]|nr:hypothetical protein DL768_002526 [Monosporascus sp. mg162]